MKPQHLWMSQLTWLLVHVLCCIRIVLCLPVIGLLACMFVYLEVVVHYPFLHCLHLVLHYLQNLAHLVLTLQENIIPVVTVKGNTYWEIIVTTEILIRSTTFLCGHCPVNKTLQLYTCIRFEEWVIVVFIESVNRFSESWWTRIAS